MQFCQCCLVQHAGLKKLLRQVQDCLPWLEDQLPHLQRYRREIMKKEDLVALQPPSFNTQHADTLCKKLPKPLSCCALHVLSLHQRPLLPHMERCHRDRGCQGDGSRHLHRLHPQDPQMRGMRAERVWTQKPSNVNVEQRSP